MAQRDGWLDPGLARAFLHILTAPGLAVILACSVRFFALAVGASDATFGWIPPCLPMAARSPGQDAEGTLHRITLPLIRSSIGTALLLAFVDGVRELPATLQLRLYGCTGAWF